MSFQHLVPRMQHHHGSRFEELFIGDDTFERLPCRAKQQIVDHIAISQCQRRQLVGNREHDLKIRDARQQKFRRRIQPVGALRTSTLRTVAITARVVDSARKVARIAPVQMTAQCDRATEFQLRQCALHLRHGLRTMVFHKVRRVAPQQIENSYYGVFGGLLLFGGCSQPGN